jgi:hypothetical protein
MYIVQQYNMRRGKRERDLLFAKGLGFLRDKR